MRKSKSDSRLTISLRTVVSNIQTANGWLGADRCSSNRKLPSRTGFTTTRTVTSFYSPRILFAFSECRCGFTRWVHYCIVIYNTRCSSVNNTQCQFITCCPTHTIPSECWSCVGQCSPIAWTAQYWFAWNCYCCRIGCMILTACRTHCTVTCFCPIVISYTVA